jgi:hypothetical protein
MGMERSIHPPSLSGAGSSYHNRRSPDSTGRAAAAGTPVGNGPSHVRPDAATMSKGIPLVHHDLIDIDVSPPLTR